MTEIVTVVLRGPFTRAEVKALVMAVGCIEAKRPDETFEVYVDAPEMEGEVDELIDQNNPPRAGYTRTITYWDK